MESFFVQNKTDLGGFSFVQNIEVDLQSFSKLFEPIFDPRLMLGVNLVKICSVV